MSVATIKRRIAVLVAMPIAAGGLTLAGATPASACTENVYKVTWNVAGVYAGPSHNAIHIKNKESGDRVTGPTGWARFPSEGNYWTKVEVEAQGFHEGWMRDDALTYVGCN